MSDQSEVKDPLEDGTQDSGDKSSGTFRILHILKIASVRTLVVVSLLAITAGVCGLSYFIQQAKAASIPASPTSLEQKTPVSIYASDGTTLLARVSPKGGVREIVPNDAIATTMKQSVVAAEDGT